MTTFQLTLKGGYFMLLKFAILDFIDDRKFNNSTEANINTNRFILGNFESYCLENNIINIEDITTSVIKEYLRMRKMKGDKPSTINSRTQRIRALFNYCIESGYVKVNPAKKVKLIHDDVRIEIFTDEQIYQMLGYYRRLKTRDKRLFASRDYMLILLLLGTGARRTEIVNLRWSDVDFESKTIKVFGKKRKIESIVITDKLIRELSSYYLFLKKYFDEDIEYVITDRYGKQITQNGIHMIMRGLKAKMNFKDVRVSCHTFRHTFCHRLATSGMSVFAIQKMMRHTNITVTMRYVAMWGNELRKQNDEFNPLNKLDV